MSPSINKHSDSVFWFDVMPHGEERFISVYVIHDEKTVLIETGPASSNTNLVKGLNSIGIGLEDVDYIIPTHIHLDHFGGGGHMMNLCPNAKAIVHPKAYVHVSNIDKWWNQKKVLNIKNTFIKNYCHYEKNQINFIKKKLNSAKL